MRRTRNRMFSEEPLAMASSEIPKRSDAPQAVRPSVGPQEAATRKARGQSGLILLRRLIPQIRFRAFDFIGMTPMRASKRSIAVKLLVRPNDVRNHWHIAKLVITGREANAQPVAKL
jgi:hypothetical protein